MNVKKIIDGFEKVIVLALLAVTAIIIVISTYELVVMVIADITNAIPNGNKFVVLNIQELLEVFSFVLLIIIGLELFEAIKQYLNQHVLQAEIMLIVALTAIARKVIVMDYQKYEPLTILGIAALALSLAVSYYMIKRVNKGNKPE